MSHGRRLGVAQVIIRLGRGGAERVLTSIANGLDPEQFDSHVITIRDAGELSADLAPHVSLHTLNRRRHWDVSSFWTFARVLREQRIDVVHTHSHLSAYFVRLARTATRARIAHVLHEHYPLIESSRLRWLDRLLLSRVDYCLAASPALGDYLRRLVRGAPSRCEVLVNAIEIGGAPVHQPSAVFTVVQIARVAPQKDQEMAIRAAARLRADLPLRWLMIGHTAGRYARRCQTMAEQLGVTSVVEFLGERSDARDLLSRAHVGVLTSRAEGLPIALLEYMAAGLPVVVTDTGETGAVVRASGGGCAVAHGDVEAFAASLRRYALDDGATRRDGEANRAYVTRHHRIDMMVEHAARVYSSCVVT